MKDRPPRGAYHVFDRPSAPRRRLRLAVTASLVASGGCGGAPPAGAGVELVDSAGVALLTSPPADRSLSVVSEPVRSLGGKDTEEESFYRVGAWNVGADRNGNIHVLDRDGYRVQVFDSAGRHLRTLGGQGGGPGELGFPFALTVAEDGRARVVDVGKRSLVQWGPDGEVHEAEPLPQGYFGGAAAWIEGGMVLPVQDSLGTHLAVVSSPGDRTILATVPATERRPVQLPSCGMSFSGMPPIFSPDLVWTARGRTVVVARNPDYVLDVFEDGRLARSLRRGVPRREATAALARASLGEGMRVRTEGGDRVCDPAEVVEQQGFAPFLPAVGRLALAPDGTLWVERYEVGDAPGAVDVFAADGRYAGTLPEGAAFPVAFLPDGRLLVAEKDALDVERLVVRTMELGEP